MRQLRWVALVGLIAQILFICGCGGGGGTMTSPLTVNILPATVTLLPGGTQVFTASVEGTDLDTVTWSADGGTIGSDGTYTAPATTGTYHITATSVDDPNAKGTATVTVATASGIVVTVDPTSATVGFNAQQQFTATVTGTSNTAVVWSTTAGGTIDQTGLFTASNATKTVTITATSAADPTKKASATVHVTNNGPLVTVTPTGATISVGETAQFQASVTNTNVTTVTWSSTGGSITQNGLFSAGDTPGTYTVKATSTSDPTRFDTAQVKVNAVTVAVIPSAITLRTGEQTTFTASVQGPQNKAVEWTSTAAGSINRSTGVFTAPSTPGTVTVTATSTFYPSAKGTATVTVVSPTDITYDFESGVPSVWTPARNEVAPHGQKLLGRFSGTEGAALNLTGLTTHRTVTVSFDLYIIGAWDGTADNGVFTVKSGGATLFDQTFSNTKDTSQSYPNGASNFPGTGRLTSDTLGYTHTPALTFNDCGYHITVTVTHTNSSIDLAFAGVLTGTLADRSWALDNVRIVANP